MRVLNWFLLRLLYEYVYVYPTASNINIFWNFGVLSGLCLVFQIITGLFLSMYYVGTSGEAMLSIEYMMRDIDYGWLVRFAHANGASVFFVAIYVHIFRSLYYGTYSTPNEYVWYVGAIIYLCLMVTAFLGYVLPWGQMSYWGATVISNLVTVVPIIGKDLLFVIFGGDTLCNFTLHRFYTLHFMLPFLILGLSCLHVYLLHKSGSRHPIGYDVKLVNKIVFFPYFVAKDSMTALLCFIFYIGLCFFYPDILGHSNNYVDANPCVTPAHIVPEWYFLSMYAILRCIPSKIGGAIAMVGFLFLMFVIPFLSNQVLGNYRLSSSRFVFWFGVSQVLCLTYLGSQLPEDPFDWLSQISLGFLVLTLINWDYIYMFILKRFDILYRSFLGLSK